MTAPPPPSPAQPNGRAILWPSIRLWPPALLLALTSLAYLSSFYGQFQFDDHPAILMPAHAQSWAAWWQSLPAIRPLLKASYVANNSSGWGLAGFHAVNLAIHLANVALVYLLLGRLANPRPTTGQPPAGPSQTATGLAPAWLAPFAGALIFGLHPAQSEAVTYLSGRSSSLMALFYLAALWLYGRGTPLGRRLSLAAFGAALLAKETAVTLPVALLLMEAAQGQPLPLAATLRRQWGHWLLLGLAGAAYLFSPTYAPFLRGSLATRGLAENLGLQLHAVWHLLELALLATPPATDPDLPWLMAHHPPTPVKLLALAALLGLGLLGWRRRPRLAWGPLWFFLHLAPTNSLVARFDPVNDRQLYLPLIGLGWLAGLALAALLRATPRPQRAPHHTLVGTAPRWAGWAAARLAPLLAAAWLGLATTSRNLDYRSETSFWEAAALQSPQKARVFNNLAIARQRSGDLDGARTAFQRALELDPQYGWARLHLKQLQAGLTKDGAPPASRATGH